MDFERLAFESTQLSYLKCLWLFDISVDHQHFNIKFYGTFIYVYKLGFINLFEDLPLMCLSSLLLASYTLSEKSSFNVQLLFTIQKPHDP